MNHPAASSDNRKGTLIPEPKKIGQFQEPKITLAADLEENILSIIVAHDAENFGVCDVDKLQSFNQSLDMMATKVDLPKLQPNQV